MSVSAPDWQRLISIAGYDRLLAPTTLDFVVDTNATQTFDTAIRNYVGILVNVGSGSGGWNDPVALQVVNDTGTIYAPAQSLPQPNTASQVLDNPGQMFFSMPFNTGDSGHIAYTGLGSSDSHVVVTCFGLSTAPAGFVLRPDGRTPAIGSRGNTVTRTTTGITALVTPSNAQCVLVKALALVVGQGVTASPQAVISGTINGVSTWLAVAEDTTTTVDSVGPVDFGDGLLLDRGKAVDLTLTLGGGGSACTGSIVYDLVA